MGKFQLRKPKIISKSFPEVGSHIDNVSRSLNDLVFSYSAQVDRALQKKHLMMALSSLVLILVVGNFISPKGRADIATFYPETCLGGWLNPRNAEKEPQTNSNADFSQFDDKNSAILDKNTNADIYCGNFNGTFNDATQPTKIIVSFALTNKEEITLGVATSTLGVVATTTATSTEVVASTTELLLLSTSTEATSSENGTADSVSTVQGSTTTEGNNSSFVDIVVDAVADTISNLFDASSPAVSETDTVVVPQVPIKEESVTPQVELTPESTETPNAPIVPESAPQDSVTPTSYLEGLLEVLSAAFITTVLAQEVPAESESSQGVSSSSPTTPDEQDSTQAESLSDDLHDVELQPTLVVGSTSEVVPEANLVVISTTTVETSSTTATSTEQTFIFASSSASSTILSDETATTSVIGKSADSQNNFLEILYTFDGVTWVSLGELNEISMKYRTFEIPLTASSTWSDMSQLQIKIATKSLERETPVVYLDSIKVEVLYESTLEYSHPDFVRDTVLKDETIDGLRLVTIINNETNEEEIWYMYLDESALISAPAEVATSTVESTTTVVITENEQASSTTRARGDELLMATSTPNVASSSEVLTIATSTSIDAASSTTATSTEVILPVIQKNKWFKLEKKERWVELSARELVEEIKKMDKEELEQKEKEDRLPDFALDVIKKIKGSLLNAVIVQIEKEGKEELWLYDLESGGQYKIEAGSSTAITIAKDMQLGLKESHVFWLSEDRKHVYAYNLLTKVIAIAEIPPHNQSIGERGRVTFDGVPWEVIIGSDDFAFYSEATGEVFSDDNGAFAEALRQKLDLDKVLNKEELGNLNLQVAESETELKVDP